MRTTVQGRTGTCSMMLLSSMRSRMQGMRRCRGFTQAPARANRLREGEAPAEPRLPQPVRRPPLEACAKAARAERNNGNGKSQTAQLDWLLEFDSRFCAELKAFTISPRK